MHSEDSPHPAPSWAWCIATYNRHDVLRLSAAMALAQTVPPHEMVVTDAGENWREGLRMLETVVEAAAAAGIRRPRLSYEKASRPSASNQRNESIARCTADVLFLLDDDSLMFPETAERILEVYRLDASQTVQAVTALGVSEPPATPGWYPWEPPAMPKSVTASSDGAAMRKRRTYSPIAKRVRRFLQADNRFIPYDDPAPAHAVPDFLKSMDVRSWRTAAGYNLTCRRSAALREPFESRLVGYSPGEDSDMTYRLTRHGPIIARYDAYLHHLQSPGSRFGLRRRTALGAINPLLLHRVHAADLKSSERRNIAMLRRRLVIEFVKDLKSRELGMPRARGILFALRNARSILRCPDEQIDEVFAYYQERA